ncbi:methionyl-tRNA formyltransferase [Ktedonosporobacter rubrisoli]|nr:formyltransferase family protein [Ktedonosporobacter rubrisoli]
MSSLPSLRIILFSLLAPATIQAFVSELETLGQHVLLLVISPGTRKHPVSHYLQIVANAPRGLDVLVASHMQRLPEILQGLSPDLILVAGFPRKFPPALLDVPRLGCVNWHPSLLPRYRGPEPIFWQFMNGETQTGITFHRMDADIDTGPILVQRDMELDCAEDLSSYFASFLPPSLAALPDALQAIVSGNSGIPQPIEGTCYAPHVTNAERWLDWTRSAKQLRRQVCLWRNLGGARATINDQHLSIHQAQVINTLPSDRSASPGSVLRRSSAGMVVQTGQDALFLQEYSCEPN